VANVEVDNRVMVAEVDQGRIHSDRLGDQQQELVGLKCVLTKRSMQMIFITKL
jgi:hypothetical protein